ncbi:hypothetical protein [Sedimenticola hydrogenitrophicus]|uniref:hypothetical protein n=1 Tax=Sedimenticola hydrogenitrophicus TaxID=2967975 RepID=UPI0021A67174|nr:hypothetical protein [Sedimenticola hydrogenitrophicus]
MNIQPTSSAYRVLFGVVFTAAALSTPNSPVLAEATGDGWLGPQVFNGEVLEQSLHALNRHIQDKYSQERQLDDLTEPRTPDFAEAAIASAAVPVIEETLEAGAFGYLVFDDRSLDNGLVLFNTEVALRGTDLFIRMAQEATSKGEDFSMAAAGAVVDEQLARYRRENAGSVGGFGDPVNDGNSLEVSVAALNQRIFDLEQRESQLAYAVPAVGGSSFDDVMLAIAISF